MDRRQFLIRAGAIAGQLLVPRFFDRALAFVENHGEPLLEAPNDAARNLLAALSEDGEYWIIDGPMPTEIPPPITWREFCNQPLFDFDETVKEWELEPHQLDQPMAQWTWEEHWYYAHSPNGRAFNYLLGLDLGPAFGEHPDAHGEIRFQEGQCIGSDFRCVMVDDFLSISLLQNRLNELGESTSVGTRITSAHR